MADRYHPITTDIVLYWFDVLQDNSLKNISKITGIHKDKVRKVLDNKLKMLA
tara:strand:+ start:9408 stop:9563 length:156 start_codon:yes stop_codon:yes gene_type:complete